MRLVALVAASSGSLIRPPIAGALAAVASAHPIYTGRRTLVTMAAVDDDEDEGGRFGFQSLLKTCQFVTLWWSLWSLYDFYLTPYSPVPELAILSVAAAYAWSEEQAARRQGPPTPIDGQSSSQFVNASAAVTLPTLWPCTSEGCSAED